MWVVADSDLFSCKIIVRTFNPERRIRNALDVKLFRKSRNDKRKGLSRLPPLRLLIDTIPKL